MTKDRAPKLKRRRLDDLDRRILVVLQTDSRTSLDRIARRVNSSRSVVQRRISQLRRTRTIRNDVSIIHRGAIDGLATFVISLGIRRRRADLVADFILRMKALPEVQQCYLTTGRSNCVMIALLRNASHLEEFVDANLANQSFIRRIRTRLVTREIKVGLAIPIDINTGGPPA